MGLLVIGIDPSLTATGVADVHGETTTVRADTVGDERLVQIVDAIHEAIHPAGAYSPLRVDLAVLEDLPTHGHGAGKTGMAQGVIRHQLQIAQIPYVSVPPATLKKYATGRGNATKADMRMALYQRAGLDVRDDNQVDAWWLRALGLHVLGEPLLALPQSHTDALVKIAVPEGVLA